MPFQEMVIYNANTCIELGSHLTKIGCYLANLTFNSINKREASVVTRAVYWASFSIRYD